MTDRLIWKSDTRPLLYRRLVEKFGPYASWQHASFPSDALRADYESFVANFALVIGAKSGGAVKHQIAYATHGNSCCDSSQAIVSMMNISAALEAGFIRYRDVPQALLVRDHAIYGQETRDDEPQQAETIVAVDFPTANEDSIAAVSQFVPH